ncbi:MAG TPA: aminotransferase class V-fold PLP-dependent enzyme [Candidatus Paceibacterota bacterium]|nr:aminotransferase class V-fold PLP-dependent enzyme [Candidatus Paceibacterota bacterium]
MLRRRRTYLDWAAGASANPSSPHAEGRRARARLEAAREAIARLVEAKPDDVIFTGGATEANALAIVGHAQARKRAGARATHMLYLPSAHASVVENMAALAARGIAVEPLAIRDAAVDIGALARQLRPETALVSMDAVCGETGVVWNTLDVRHALDAARPGGPRILLHVDASQAPLTEKMTRAHFGADLLTLDASKVSLVRGIGALVAHRTIALAPLYAGGGQERGLCPGSEAPELALRFAEGLAAAAQGRERFRARATRDRAAFLAAITAAVPGVSIQEGAQQAPHIVNLSLPGRDTDYLVALLDEAGYAVSTKSACETDSEEGSRAVFALTGDAVRARSTLRVSFGPATSSRALAAFARALIRAVAFIDTHARR